MVAPPTCYLCSIEGNKECPDCELIIFGKSNKSENETRNRSNTPSKNKEQAMEKPGPALAKENAVYFCERHSALAKKYTKFDFYLVEPLLTIEAYHFERNNKRYFESANLANEIYENIKDRIYIFPPIVKKRFIELDGPESLKPMFWIANSVIDYALYADRKEFTDYVNYLEKEGIKLNDILPFMNNRIDNIKNKSELKTILTVLATIKDKKGE